MSEERFDEAQRAEIRRLADEIATAKQPRYLKRDRISGATPTDGQPYIYESATGKWISGTPGDTVAHGLTRHTEFNTWKVFYTDASGDEQEIAVGADGTVLLGKGTSATPAFGKVDLGDDTEGDLVFAKQTKTIDANDEITVPTTSWVYLTPASGATDGLDGIGAGTEGQIVFLTPTAGNNITLVHNGTVTAGKKLMIVGDSDALLGDDHDFVIAVYDATATAWNVLVPFQSQAGANPGGEVGGTWPNITVNATHSGSAHHAQAHAADHADGTDDIQTATTAQKGIVSELATAAEAAAGTDSSRVVTPSLMPVIIQDSKYAFAADAEASDTYAISMTPNIAAYATGQKFIFTANTANTGACTLDVDGKGAKTIKKNHDADLADNDIEAGSVVEVVYDGTSFQMTSQLGNAGGGGGDVTKVGTPVNDQIGVWTGDGTIEGNANATIDSTGAFEVTATEGHGMGVAGLTSSTLRISPTKTSASQFLAVDISPAYTASGAGSSFRGVSGTPSLNLAGNSISGYDGLYYQPAVFNLSGTPTLTQHSGIRTVPQKIRNDTLTTTDMSSVRATGSIVGTNLTCTRFNTLWAEFVGSSQVTDMTGLRISDITAGTQKVLIWAGPNVPSSTGVTNLRLDAGNPTDAASATEGDSQLYLTFMENGSLAMLNVRWRQNDQLGASDKVLIGQ